MYFYPPTHTHVTPLVSLHAPSYTIHSLTIPCTHRVLCCCNALSYLLTTVFSCICDTVVYLRI